jgi:hypothetical protein
MFLFYLMLKIYVSKCSDSKCLNFKIWDIFLRLKGQYHGIEVEIRPWNSRHKLKFANPVYLLKTCRLKDKYGPHNSASIGVKLGAQTWRILLEVHNSWTPSHYETGRVI